MRIHSLTMTGIGPYAGQEHIDFDAVGASGRFLLTGPTGSGKTTIIDAIVFALYGDVADSADSSKERIRSTLVGPHTESVIELVFSTGAGVYRVRRTPTYERAKRRGQGTTTQNGTVKLWRLAEVGGEPLDEPVTRVGDADAEIARAVGLSREQFTQTVVLPQGKFARFLRADSSERQHLLKDVFGTGIYDAIQDALIQASRDGARRVEQAAADLRGQVASLGRHPLLTEAPSPAEPIDAGEETADADQVVLPEDSSPSNSSPQTLPGGTQEALPLPMDDAGRDELAEAAAAPAPTPAQALEAAMAGATPDLVALRRIDAQVLEASRNRVASADARSEAAGAALTRAQSAREEAQSLHDLLDRRRALIEENERLAERAEQDADDARRLQAAERASRVRPYLVAEQAARRRADRVQREGGPHCNRDEQADSPPLHGVRSGRVHAWVPPVGAGPSLPTIVPHLPWPCCRPCAGAARGASGPWGSGSFGTCPISPACGEAGPGAGGCGHVESSCSSFAPQERTDGLPDRRVRLLRDRRCGSAHHGPDVSALRLRCPQVHGRRCPGDPRLRLLRIPGRAHADSSGPGCRRPRHLGQHLGSVGRPHPVGADFGLPAGQSGAQ